MIWTTNKLTGDLAHSDGSVIEILGPFGRYYPIHANGKRARSANGRVVSFKNLNTAKKIARSTK